MRIASATAAALLLVAAALGAACATGGPSTLPTPVLPTRTAGPPTRDTTPIAPVASTVRGTTPTSVAGTPTAPASSTVSASTGSRAGSLGADDVTRALTAAKVTATKTGQTVICGSGPASSGQVWQASAQGEQQQFVLWVYPDHASLESDWVAEIGKPPQPRLAGCVSEGSGNWNANLVLYIQGRDIGTLTAAIRNAFLSLGN